MWFLASLVTTFSAVYTYQKVERSSAEVATICVALGLIGLVLSLIIAPWPIQLALVVGLLLSSRLWENRY